MIEIKKSPDADSRTGGLDVTIDRLKSSTESHISDVVAGMNFIADLLKERAISHDHTKIENMEQFHAALTSGHIKDSDWYKMHVTSERHHLLSHVPNNVTLIDVMEHLVDCTMAGLARSGSVYDIVIPPEVLALAVSNTVELLKRNTHVVQPDADLLNEPVDEEL